MSLRGAFESHEAIAGALVCERGRKTVSRISSPEQLNDYLHVTNPRIWMLLVAVALLVAGLLLWSAFATVESYATGTARASDGELEVTFDDPEKATNVKPGMEMQVGGETCEVLTVGTDNNNNVVAFAKKTIPDGTYSVRVGYSTVQVISMLFN